MRARPGLRTALQAAAVGAGIAAGAYAGYAAFRWSRYGRVQADGSASGDELLDRFMPRYEIVERHSVLVAAPAKITLATAKEQDLWGLPLIRAIFKARALALGASHDKRPDPKGLLDAAQSLGWGVLGEVPDREIVVGAVTKPWEPNVTFRALPPDAFADYGEPGFVKIAWTLRADPIGPCQSVFRTETRAVATDQNARNRFRRYWALVSPGVEVIRYLSLRPLKREAERRAMGSLAKVEVLEADTVAAGIA